MTCISKRNPLLEWLANAERVHRESGIVDKDGNVDLTKPVKPAFRVWRDPGR